MVGIRARLGAVRVGFLRQASYFCLLNLLEAVDGFPRGLDVHLEVLLGVLACSFDEHHESLLRCLQIFDCGLRRRFLGQLERLDSVMSTAAVARARKRTSFALIPLREATQ